MIPLCAPRGDASRRWADGLCRSGTARAARCGCVPLHSANLLRPRAGVDRAAAVLLLRRRVLRVAPFRGHSLCVRIAGGGEAVHGLHVPLVVWLLAPAGRQLWGLLWRAGATTLAVSLPLVVPNPGASSMERGAAPVLPALPRRIAELPGLVLTAERPAALHDVRVRGHGGALLALWRAPRTPAGLPARPGGSTASSSPSTSRPSPTTTSSWWARCASRGRQWASGLGRSDPGRRRRTC